MSLKHLINKAINTPPPKLDIYGDYYSPYYGLMYILAGTIDNGLLVELGVNKGRGLVSLAAGNKTNQVIGLDSHLWNNIFYALKDYPNAWFLNVSSMPVPIVIAEHARKINLLHIDTEHSYSMAKAEFEAYQPYLAKGAYVLFDDLHAQDDDVLRYFNELPYEKLQDDRLHPSCGYGVLRYD
jgi:cephalosporin hydroxylase